MTPDIEVLRSVDVCLSKCGRPVAPSGLASVDLYQGIFYQAVVGNQDTQQQPLEISGDTTFFLKAISGMQAPSLVYVQFFFPNGRALQQALQQWNQIAGVGSNRYVLDKEIPCEPGTKILITGDTSINNPGSSQPFSVLFEGAYRYYIKPGGVLSRAQIATDQWATLPRIFKTRNQNIMAPRWMTGDFPGPQGAEWFTYVSPESTFAVPSAGTGNTNNRVQTPTENGYEFYLGRMHIVYSFDSGATDGVPYIRVREGSGRKLHDDYVNADNFSGQALSTHWRVAPGRDIITDLAVMDSGGTGNITVQYYFEGWRKRA